jgi:hypothetical protein
MTIILERPLATVLEPTQVWGVLLSSYSVDTGVITVHASPDAALRYGERARAARPGIESELMTCIGSGPWMSVDGEKSVDEVISERWAR